MNCWNFGVAIGCHTDGFGARIPVLVNVRDDGQGQPLYIITDTAGNPVFGADETNTTPGKCSAQDITYVVQRQTGPLTLAAPYRSISFTAISDDCTINSVAVPLGFNWTVGAEEGAQVINSTNFGGTDYIATVVY